MNTPLVAFSGGVSMAFYVIPLGALRLNRPVLQADMSTYIIPQIVCGETVFFAVPADRADNHKRRAGQTRSDSVL